MLCNYLQNVAAITYIFVLQLSTFLFYNKHCIVSGASSVTGSMATKLKQYSDEGNLTELAVQLILNEKKTETGKVTLTEKKIRKYFPKEYNREQIEQVIYELLDNWKKSQ